MQKDIIYDVMNGHLTEDAFSMHQDVAVADEFADGKECARLYEEVYRAKLELCRRLGETENREIEIIIRNMERISRVLAIRMYEYGRGASESVAGQVKRQIPSYKEGGG